MRVISLIFTLILFLVISTVMAQPESSNSRVRFWNVTDDVPAVDIYVDGELVFEDLKPGAFSDFLPIAAGDYELFAVRADEGIEGERFLTTGFSIAPEQWTNAMIFGSIAGNFVGVQMVERNPTNFLNDRVRFDIVNSFLQGSFTITLDSEAPETLPSGSATTLEISFGTHELVIRDDESGTAIYENHELIIAPFQSYFLTFSRVSGQITPIIITVNLSAAIIVNHFVVDMPPVAVRLNGEQVQAVFPYESYDLSVAVRAGDYTLEIVRDNVPEPEVYFTQDNFSLAPGETLSITMIGQLVDDSLKVTIETPSTPDYSGNAFVMAGKNAVINLYHEISDAPPIDVILSDGTTMIESLAFRDGIAVLDLPAGSYDLLITVENDPDTVLFDLPGITFVGGNVYEFLAIGSYQNVLDGEQDLLIKSLCVRPEGCE